MNDALSGPTRKGEGQGQLGWLPWLIVVVAVAALIGCFATRPVPTPEPQIVQQTLIPSLCDPDHIITIQKDCSAYPSPLDPVLPGRTIMFKNRMDSPITIDVAQGVFADPQIKIPAGGAECRTVEQGCEAGEFTYLVVNPGCDTPPIESRPRIIVHSAPAINPVG